MTLEAETTPSGEAALGVACESTAQEEHGLDAGDRDQNLQELIGALRMFDPAGDLHLAAICPDGQRPPLFRAVRGNFAGAAEWIQRLNADRRNIFWQPNAVRPGLTGKASAEDIAAVRFFQVDIDPPKDGGDFDTRALVETLDALPTPPSFIIHSGGGVQAFWRLSRPSYV